MGILDTYHCTIECASCGVKETTKILDKGDRYSGSYWQSRGKFDQFFTEWSQESRNQEPSFVSGTCKDCGGTAQVEGSKFTQ